MSATRTDVRDEMVKAVRDLTRREVTPFAAALDAGDSERFARCWASARALGLDRVLLGDDLGGAGLGPAELLAMIEETAAGDAGLAVAVLLHNVALAALPSQAVAAVADGERWSLALPPQNPRLALDVTASPARVCGRIPFVPGALGADGVVVLAPSLGPGVLVLRPTTPGLTIRPDPSQMGWRGAPAATLVLDGVDNTPATLATPVRQPVGPCATASRLVRGGVAAVARGIARRAWELALDYARSRHQGGVPIIEHGAVRDLLAGMAAHLEGVGPSATSGVWPSHDDRGALAAKVLASDAAVAVTTDAVQVFGGTGYMCETGVEKLMRDAMYCRLYPEPNWLARDRLVGCFERSR
jgi:alkylation response protein AidB-like acyl-CoA dehydrogenase